MFEKKAIPVSERWAIAHGTADAVVPYARWNCCPRDFRPALPNTRWRFARRPKCRRTAM